MNSKCSYLLVVIIVKELLILLSSSNKREQSVPNLSYILHEDFLLVRDDVISGGLWECCRLVNLK